VRWTDIQAIAIALEETYPGVDILGVRFTDLYQWILDLEEFEDAPERCNEKLLEAIQMAWLDERS
jgi:FeS assembly protein IscX